MAAVELKVNVDAPIGAIMSVNFYQSPLTSTIREVLANAVDASMDARSSRIPEVRIDSKGDNVTLRIRDFGNGLSEEDVYGVFGGLFNSSKSNNVMATGGFGLGSKSPFSIGINRTFYVKSYQNGYFKLFKFWIDASTMKALCECTSAEVTGEPNGIEVIIPVGYSEMTVRSAVDNVGSNCLSNFKVFCNNMEVAHTQFIPPAEDAEIHNDPSSKITVAVNNMIYEFRESKISNALPYVNYYISATKFDIHLTPQRERIPDTEENIRFIYSEVERLNKTISDETKLKIANYNRLIAVHNGYALRNYACGNLVFQGINEEILNIADIPAKYNPENFFRDYKDIIRRKIRVPAFNVDYDKVLLVTDVPGVKSTIDPVLVLAKKKAPKNAGTSKENVGPKHDFAKEFHKRDSMILGMSNNRHRAWNEFVDTSAAENILKEYTTMVVRRDDCTAVSVKQWAQQTFKYQKKVIVRRCTNDFFNQYVAEHPEADLLKAFETWENEKKIADLIAKAKKRIGISKGGNYAYEYYDLYEKFSDAQLPGVTNMCQYLNAEVTAANAQNIIDHYDQLYRDGVKAFITHPNIEEINEIVKSLHHKDALCHQVLTAYLASL